MSKFNLSSIKVKLILVSTLILIIPLSILGIISYKTSETSLDELGSQNLANSVEMTIEMIEALNKEVEKGNLPLGEAQESVKEAILGEKASDGTRPINKNIDLGDNGYLLILDEKGTVLAHPAIEGENTWDAVDENGLKFTQETIKVGQEGGGFVYYDWPMPGDENNIAPKVSYSKIDPHWDWIISSGTYMIDFNEPAKNIITIISIVIGVSLLLGGFIIWMFANNISKPIHTIVDHMNSLSAGDLTRDSIQIKSKDETGVLASAMNQMQDRLKEIIHSITSAADTITSRSEELTQSSHDVQIGSNQIATTMEELASAAELQADSTSELSTTMQSYDQDVQEASGYGENIHNSSRNVLTITEEGNQLMASSKDQMTMIDQIVNDAVEKVHGLDAKSQEISNLVSVIQDIADQTNLLALNAAIEAARAGDHGAGFAVVADEVRKLAEQVSDSVTDITNIVVTIQSESNSVTSTLEEGYKEVEQGTNQIEATSEKFDGINQAVTEMANMVESVSSNLMSIASNSQQMNRTIEDIAASSQQAAAGVEQTSAASQQTSSAMEEVAVNSEDLAKLAEDLNELVNQFKV